MSLISTGQPLDGKKLKSQHLLLNKKIIDSSKLKEFAEDNFKFDEKGRKFLKRVENTVGKGENCSLREISPIPTVFSKDVYY